ncbi:UV-stimulated scaffold protein A-like [Centruroides sculpturatus]|uniref:UV-stimulated scaffold protein A-like n=1 Tax=Centruroides sculpturatus TaxID=218467 RepID=UPI000C6EED4A|nr:UV-stimulated scaffold protein A-like [Centruroides sculpturatus]XP_023210647.1 UV-stimulated scaffold protein A-like [Centruroides sculpturatus]XP_023210648.1 UV-stimulated scaffold protein A-like [Centruroides sculpturatus]XP_023210649.1 UV-stimulated scaffold protein A-like [Centruroides sculpturatus]XP_023210650.1 UV-stimulated scaffold protein A-like [Centruroides sculpturatus]XP_023210651.1 UV-stimulated scaffold protein A-like [Centruroides sculpturatus]
MASDLELRNELSAHLEQLTTNGDKELNQEIMKKVKNICKKSEEYVNHAFHVIMMQICKPHSEIRYSSLLVINELFKRSHIFRKLLLSDFQNFLELCAETNKDKLLPPPKNVGKNLKIKTLKFVQEWNDQFGEDYKRLKLGFNFLRECKKIDFANLQAQDAFIQRRDEEARQRQENIIQDKVNKTLVEMTDKIPEIESVLNQMDNCFNLLFPTVNDFCNDLETPSTSKLSSILEESSENDKEDLEDKLEVDEMMRHHGLKNMKDNYNLEIVINPCVHMNTDTLAIIENLKDLHTQINKCLLPMVGKWLNIFTKGSNCSGSLKRAIDLKNLLMTKIEKFRELKILPEQNSVDDDHEEEEEEEEFIAVEEKEGLETVIPPHLRHEYGLEPINNNNNKQNTKVKDNVDETKDPTTVASNLHAIYEKMGKKLQNRKNEKTEDPVPCCSKDIDIDAKKAEMLSKAPHKPYDIDLYHWEDEKLEAPTIIKYEPCNKFWLPSHVDVTEFQLKDGAAALRMRKIDFTGEFVPVKWSCRAPLPSGKLCPRKDRYKCPFHGKIVPRDKYGNKVNSDEKSKLNIELTNEESVPDWQDPELLRDLEATTGINLKMPEKRKKLQKKSFQKKKKKYPNLTDVTKEENTVRKRLEKKVFNKRAVQNICEQLDSIDRKKYDDKFGDQWAYAFK